MPLSLMFSHLLLLFCYFSLFLLFFLAFFLPGLFKMFLWIFQDAFMIVQSLKKLLFGSLEFVFSKLGVVLKGPSSFCGDGVGGAGGGEFAGGEACILVGVFFGHIILQLLKSPVNSLIKFQNMLASTKSYKDFKRVIASSTSHLKSERPTEVASGGQLCLESRVDENDGCLLGLESEKSKLSGLGVKSSIDSDKKRKSANSSIPLSQLILRDNGYDYLFNVENDPKKLQNKYRQNMKQIMNQTRQMIDLIHLHLIAIESQEISEHITTLQKQIRRIRANRVNKSPVPQYSEYLGVVANRKQRRTGKRIAAELRQSRSNVRTQCDSKGPSIPSAPATPTPRCKMLVSPKKQFLLEYYQILKSKKQTIQNSIETISSFYTKRIDLYKQENNAYQKEIMLLDSKSISSPQRNNHFRAARGTVGPTDSSKSNCKSHRRLLGFYSPRESREPRKSQTPRLLSRARRQFMAQAREQYFISN